MASLERYAEVRRRYPEAGMLMGIGNLTELTSADSTGVNALLIAICQELGVRAVLTTEVIPWARGAVREIDIARRLMHYAVTARTIPKGVDDRLVTVKDPAVLDVRRGRAARAAGRRHRLRTSASSPTGRRSPCSTTSCFVRGTDIQEIFAQLGVDEADARVLPGEGAGEGQAGDDARQDLPPGGRAVLGLPHAARRRRGRST